MGWKEGNNCGNWKSSKNFFPALLLRASGDTGWIKTSREGRMKTLSKLISWVYLMNPEEPGSHFSPTKHRYTYFLGVHVKLLSSNRFGISI